MAKDTLFISHAQPEDNYFCIWLASKLRLIGYKVWLELDDLSGGNSFTPKIEAVIRNDTVMSLVVLSNAYLDKWKTPHSGAAKEASLLTKLARGSDNFIVPLQVENFPVDDLPMDFSGVEKVSFYDNWATGLARLIKILSDENVVKAGEADNVLSQWHEDLRIEPMYLQREERYYTNWFELKYPEKIYVHKVNVIDWKEVYKLPNTFRSSRDLVISFFSREECERYVLVHNTYEYNSKDFEVSTELTLSSETDVLKRPDRLFIALLNQIFKRYMVKKGLYKYELSNREAYYYYDISNDENRIKLSKYGKSFRTLWGKSTDYRWHFAISSEAHILPFPHYQLSSHLYFTAKGGELLEGGDIQHSLRRTVPVDWFNRKWFETLLAISVKISDNSDNWKIEVADEKYVMVSTLPFEVQSPVAYKEPNNAE